MNQVAIREDKKQNKVAVKDAVNTEHELSVIEQVVMQGDLAKLSSEQRVTYYRKVCESAGLNPFTRPFEYISLNGKLTLYAKKDATEQLRKLNGISITKLEARVVDDLYIVTATARTNDGRTDESTGAVVIGHLKGEMKANAIMKAETKAKRRVTLSISGMGWTDESEVESIPNAKMIEVDLSSGEINTPGVSKVSKSQAEELISILDLCDPQYQMQVLEFIKKAPYNAPTLYDLPSSDYERLKRAAMKKKDEAQATSMFAEIIENSKASVVEITEKVE